MDIESVVSEHLLAALPKGWRVRVVSEHESLATSFCIDNERGLFRRKVLVPQPMIEDAPGHGGPGWVLGFLKRQGVVEEILGGGDERNDAAIVVRYDL